MKKENNDRKCWIFVQSMIRNVTLSCKNSMRILNIMSVIKKIKSKNIIYFCILYIFVLLYRITNMLGHNYNYLVNKYWFYYGRKVFIVNNREQTNFELWLLIIDNKSDNNYWFWYCRKVLYGHWIKLNGRTLETWQGNKLVLDRNDLLLFFPFRMKEFW